MGEHTDLLDLCRLNLMEDNIADSQSVDRDSTLAAIHYKKRQLMEKIPKPHVSKNALETHLERNQPDDFLLSIVESLQEIDGAKNNSQK